MLQQACMNRDHWLLMYPRSQSFQNNLLFRINIWELFLWMVWHCTLSLSDSFPFCVFFPVEFNDCAGNENVQFEVSDHSFQVDGDLNLVPQQDVPYSSPVLFIHGLSVHADDMAQVELTGLPVRSPHTLRVSRNWWFVCSTCIFISVFIFHSSKLKLTYLTSLPPKQTSILMIYLHIWGFVQFFKILKCLLCHSTISIWKPRVCTLALDSCSVIHS